MATHSLYSQAAPSSVFYGSVSATTYGTIFTISGDYSLTGIWYYSGASDAVLPSACGVFDVATQASVASDSSPSWSGALGSGWVKCTFDGSVTLDNRSRGYIVCIEFDGGNKDYNVDITYPVSASPLTAPVSDATSGLNNAPYVTNGVLTFPNTDGGGGFNWFVDVEASDISSGVSGDGAASMQKMSVSGAGNAPPIGTGAASMHKMSVTGTGNTAPGVVFDSTDGNGIDTYTVTSGLNNASGGGPQDMRVLEPTAPSSDYDHAFLWMLPVEPNQGTTYGDSVGTAFSLSAHNDYNLTVIQPGVLPDGFWGGDNPLDASISQESFLLALVNWANSSALATTGTEKHYLIGFSRSGLGAQDMIFRHPDIFEACASWDFPASMTDYDGTDPDHGPVFGGSDVVYGTSANFTTNYELDSGNLTTWKNASTFGTVNRVWIGGYNAFQADLDAYDTLLTSVGIEHTYTYQVNEAHAWDSDWVSAALGTIIERVGTSGTATTAMPKMSVAGTGNAPLVGTGATTMPKMGLSGSGTETIPGAGSAAMHKMSIAGSAALIGSSAVIIPKMSVSGIGNAPVVGTGGVTIPKMALLGAGIPGSNNGAASMHKMSVSGAAKLTIPGTGSAHLNKMSLAGTGNAPLVGTSATAMHKMRLSGSGAPVQPGNGAAEMHKMRISGVGNAPVVGTGSVALPKMRLTGSGTFTFSGTGNVTMHKMTLTGSSAPIFGRSTISSGLTATITVTGGT